MASRASPILLALALLTVTALPAVLAGSPTRTATDVVAVDAASGERLSPPAEPRTNVTVHVENVEPSTGGFDLVGPPGPLFVNQTSRHDGVVEFWDVPAGPGTYEVQVATDDGNETIASFSVTNAAGPQLDCEDGDEATCTAETQWCWGYTSSEKLADEIHWTPLITVNSPSDGRATASSTWTKTESVYVSPGSWESRTTHSEEIEASDGRSAGFYRLSKWGIYERTRHYCWDNDYTWKEAKVVDWEPNGYVEETRIELTGESRYTDRDNPTQLTLDDTTTIRHDTRYLTKDRKRSGESTHTVNDEEIVGIGGGVSAGNHYVSFDLISFKIADGETLSYTYHFEDDDGTWFVHDLEDSPGWAFCRSGMEDC